MGLNDIMLKKLYDKSKIWFAVLFIILYCVLFSLGDYFSTLVGTQKLFTFDVGLIITLILLSFLKKYGLFEEYGLCKPKSSIKSMIFYLPILVMLSVNLWGGVTLNYSVTESVLCVLSMFLVGFLEEIIFRGLLFNAMKTSSIKWAVIVSSVTFGIGHIINLFNGSNADLIPNLLQVVYATTAGFMFVTIYLKSKSLIVCIVSHGLFNALSVFSTSVLQDFNMQIITAVVLTIVTGAYAVYLALSIKKEIRVE